MSKARVVIYKNLDGTVPLLEWLDCVPPKVQDKFIVRVELLREMGHMLRRPHCDYLRDGIYELRVRHGNVNYRILYCFCGGKIALLSHGCTKEKKVPSKEIERALRSRLSFEGDPEVHTYQEEL